MNLNAEFITLSEPEFELRGQSYKIRDSHQLVPETSQADRCTRAIKPSIANSTGNGIHQTHG